MANSGIIEPKINYMPPPHCFESLPSAFPSLEEPERTSEWGKELYLGLQFAEEFDLYRAITCYKRALYLAPSEQRLQIEYHILEAYYLGGKHQEVIETFESGQLGNLPLTFPALKETLLMLYDSYVHVNQCEKAQRIYNLLNTLDATMAENLLLFQAVSKADFCALEEMEDEDLDIFLATYHSQEKSVKQAQTLNALLPGAGYLYVGQSKTALTSFVINILFAWAAYEFFDRGYIAAGLITSSLEMGWYLGGINGAGIAAREWNESLYAAQGKEYLLCKRLFPVMMFSYAF